MNELSGSYYFINGSYRKTTAFRTSPSCAVTDLYEVLRIHDGICLFFEEHFERLLTSVRLSGNTTSLHQEDIRPVIQALIRKNRMNHGNIKIVLRFETALSPALLIYRIPHFYPSPASYRNGVRTSLFKVTREHPNVKIVLPALRQQLIDFINSKHIYEALLVNNLDCITEGSRSNLFFVDGNVLYTAPGDQVLRGITRRKIIEICKKLNYKLIESPISINDLNKFESAFITGTSPKVLPVRSIDLRKFLVFHPVIEAITRAYDELIKDYINANRILL